MIRYKNVGRNSGIWAYEIGTDYIKVQFANSERIYTYSYESAGIIKVEKMKELALLGQGLNSYITKYARMDYVK